MDSQGVARQLRDKVAEMRARLEALEALAAEVERAPSSGPSPGGGPPLEATEAERMAEENIELASRLAEAEEMNAAMMNMYVSSHGLHASLDPARVIDTVMEVVINFVGGEVFAILVRREDHGDFEVVAGEGHQDRYPNPHVEAQGVLGAVVASAEPFVHVDEEEPREGILAAVPLAVQGRVVGAVVIHKLLAQKPRLEPADIELLHLLSSHAATALINARLHARVERKLRTLESLVAMLRESRRPSAAPPPAPPRTAAP